MNRKIRVDLDDPDEVLDVVIARVLMVGLCFLIVLLLQLRASAAIWETVPLISFVQFPQRLRTIGNLRFEHLAVSIDH